MTDTWREIARIIPQERRFRSRCLECDWVPVVGNLVNVEVATELARGHANDTLHATVVEHLEPVAA